jgi:hypothetical protein
MGKINFLLEATGGNDEENTENYGFVWRKIVEKGKGDKPPHCFGHNLSSELIALSTHYLQISA